MHNAEGALTSWATLSQAAHRRDAEPADELRTPFQADRERIVHTKAFRRLMHKTQVFLAPEGDHYRTRLTHTLEVALVSRTICRALRLNEDLAEAVALAHDMGHTPFGHVGEDALTKAMGRPFEHNRQSLRIADHLERLNLTEQVRDGILNHTWRMPEPSTPEALVTRWADRIAYVNHDLDDAVRAGIVRPTDVPRDVAAMLGETYPARQDAMVRGIVLPSREADAVVMRPDVAEAMAVLRSFLFERVYLGPARSEEEKAAGVLEALYHHYASCTSPDDAADYVSGMTDRFALRDYQRLFVPKSL